VEAQTDSIGSSAISPNSFPGEPASTPQPDCSYHAVQTLCLERRVAAPTPRS